MIVVWIVLVLLIGASTLVMMRNRRRDATELEALHAVQQRAAAVLTVAESDSVPPQADERRTQTTRDQREIWIRERDTQGLCRYCEERATKQYPAFEPVRPLMDRVLRYFNATPNNRWTIKLDRGIDVVSSLCSKHHEWQLGYFEEIIAQERSKNSKFAAEQRLLMYEFERFGSDERALDEMLVIRRGNRKRSAPAKVDGNVIRLPSNKRVENG